jgi:hypothetical protein
MRARKRWHNVKMSAPDLVQELNSLRIKHGTSNVYKTLLNMMRREYEELSELFGCGTNIPGSCQNSNPAGLWPTSLREVVSASDYYNEFMFLNNRAMAETLEEQCYNLHELDMETISQDEDVDLEIEEDVDVEDDIDIGFYGFGEAGLGETDVKIISTEDKSSVATSVEDRTPRAERVGPDIKEIITETHPAGLRPSSLREVVKSKSKRTSKKKD